MISSYDQSGQQGSGAKHVSLSSQEDKDTDDVSQFVRGTVCVVSIVFTTLGMLESAKNLVGLLCLCD